MRKNIAVVNRTNLKNYGSVLQVYALCHAVRNLGYDSEIVWESGNMSRNYDIRPNKIIKTGLKLLFHPSLLSSTIKTIKEVKNVKVDESKIALFDDFVEKHIDQTLYPHDELVKNAASDKYDKFVVGSDQIWCTTTLYVDPMMYLRFAPKNKRIAYAPSLGRNYIPGYNKRIMRKYINDIPCVSVREEKGKELIKELTGRDVPVVVDPSLLLTSADWDKLKVEVEKPSRYVLCYFLDEPSDTLKNSIMAFAKKRGLFIFALGQFGAFCHPEVPVYYPVTGPCEFLDYVSKATVVITDSYHGMLFSINYKRRFWAVARDYKQFDQSSRHQTVLKRLNLENRYLTSQFNFTLDDIDFDKVHEIINADRTFSLNYLNESIEK